MVMPATQIVTQTIPAIVAVGATTKIVGMTMKRNGKVVGSWHYHFKGSKPHRHKHEGGHLSHEHRGLRGYGRTRKSLKRF